LIKNQSFLNISNLSLIICLIFDLTNLVVDKTPFNKRKPYNTFISVRLLEESFDSARKPLWDIAGDSLVKL
jgi:hypothetical protein